MKQNRLIRVEDFITPCSYCAHQRLCKSNFSKPFQIKFYYLLNAYYCERSRVSKPFSSSEGFAKAKFSPSQKKLSSTLVKPLGLRLKQARFAFANNSSKIKFAHSFYTISTTNYKIVRPLLNCSRRTITMACILSKLPVYPDVTNVKVRYSRNRLRKQIIPSLQFFFNPEVEKALFKFSEFLPNV